MFFLFAVIKIQPSKNSGAIHDLFVKEHSVRQKTVDRPTGRTLFVLNVPPYVNKQNFSDVFTEAAGDVQNVFFAEKATVPLIEDPTVTSKYFPESELFKFKVAYVVFKRADGLENALELSVLPPLDCKRKLLTGVDKWTQEFTDKMPLDETVFEQEINDFMAIYDEDTGNKKTQKDEEEDDGGWVTVGKGGKKTFEQKESVINKLEGKVEQGKQKKELRNFYTFQIRENKMKDIISLRRKFEQDKQKIQSMKKTRRFKPF